MSTTSNKAELIFIPSPWVGHLVSTVEIAKLLVSRDQRLSITVFIINVQSEVLNNNSYPNILSSFSSSERINFVSLPAVKCDFTDDPLRFLTSLLELQKPHVKEALNNFIAQPNSPKLAGFVVDMFCMPMIDLANQFNRPTYLFYTSGAGMLSVSFHFLKLLDEENKDTTEFRDSDVELTIPGYVNPVPAKVLPWVVVDSHKHAQSFLDQVRRYKEVKGIMVNSFVELESAAVDALSNGGNPPMYPVGPILSLSESGIEGAQSDIMKWLDDQPKGSVVFLCFGSMGSFPEAQVKEIAIALEKNGCRFLWSLRKCPPKGKLAMPSDLDNPSDVLPEGFLDRTVGIGKVIGWAPQVAILAHPSIGGFVSHCGWNSTLESIWFGVPIATWPLYAEQQMNAFTLVKEYGLAVEIKMDYKKNPMSNDVLMIVGADEIERGLRGLVGIDVEKREKVKEMSEKSRKALDEGGSSYAYLGKFIEDLFNNIP